mmetsp:Transcript_21320/g.53735  ORF Transcript_21320/g.53735 Transcript_21320/m.53735 type:complete len:91 (-) Transcript_21320:186-458(-)
MNIIPCLWVFNAKADGNGEVEEYKARLVACGSRQHAGHDFTEDILIIISSLRELFVTAAAKRLYLGQLDAVTAYLNAEIPGRGTWSRSAL